MNKFIKFILTCIFILNYSMASARSINILTWWGYLDSPWIGEMVKNQCHVDISYDSYSSNPEMIRRWSENKSAYDILIFSNAVYKIIKNEISLNNSKLYENARFYHPVIRDQYFKSHFSNNIAYFQHTFTGFIWNPRLINLNESDTVQTAFQKSKSHMVIILDDPVEVSMLLSLTKNKNNNDFFSVNSFQKLTKDSNVMISNQLNQIYDNDDFAFAYQWSGVGIAEIKNRKQYKFTVNEKLSYISTDLVAQLTSNKYSACVANLLSSKEFLSRLQQESYYFSPYGDYESITDSQFKKIYVQFIHKLPILHWIDPPDKKNFQSETHRWDMIKYEISK